MTRSTPSRTSRTPIHVNTSLLLVGLLLEQIQGKDLRPRTGSVVGIYHGGFDSDSTRPGLWSRPCQGQPALSPALVCRCTDIWRTLGVCNTARQARVRCAGTAGYLQDSMCVCALATKRVSSSSPSLASDAWCCGSAFGCSARFVGYAAPGLLGVCVRVRVCRRDQVRAHTQRYLVRSEAGGVQRRHTAQVAGPAEGLRTTPFEIAVPARLTGPHRQPESCSRFAPLFSIAVFPRATDRRGPDQEPWTRSSLGLASRQRRERAR